MKLLILTQKIDANDPILGFFVRWVEEFAKHCEQVTVICLEEGKHNFYSAKNAVPRSENSEEFSGTVVRVFSLGKEKKRNSLQKLFTFYFLLFTLRKDYDAVFVHMNPVYVILGGLFWRACGERVGLWYTHKHIDLKLRIAEKISHIIFTASEKSFRLPSRKVLVMGHGIDVMQWMPRVRESHKVIQIMTVGRIAPVKDYETLLGAMVVLIQQNIPIHLDIIGDVAKDEDKMYLAKLKEMVRTQGMERFVAFVGAVSNRLLPERVASADIFVNMSKTGSLDKAVLEAMACGSITVTSNEAFEEVLGEDAPMLMFQARDAESLAEKIKAVNSLDQKEKNELTKRLRNVIVEKHNIEVLIPRILTSYETSR